jgi:hypothetical protein
MPVLPWRNDADGFAFKNVWTFDATERAALAALARPLIPAAASMIVALIPSPSLFVELIVAGNSYTSFAPLRTYGLCGGMAYSALDHWNARVPIPRGANEDDRPARTATASAAIRNVLWQRLLDSLGPGGVLQKTLEWSFLLNQVPVWLGGGAEGLKNRTRLEWDLLRRHIDAGRPWPIGLIISTRDVWDQHQILVYGYENTGPNKGKIFVYDSNKPHQFGSGAHHEVSLNFEGPTLIAPDPSDGGHGTLAGFFCSNYFPDRPVGMAKSYGEFLSWTGDGTRTWMVNDGARMPIANSTELTALGGTPQTVRPTLSPFATSKIRPRDGAMFRELSSTLVFLYAGGAPFLLPDGIWVDRFGGISQVRMVPDNTIAAFNGPPDNHTLLREWSDPKVWRIMNGVRRWVRTPEELDNGGGFPSVRVVPDAALAAIPVGQPLGTPRTWAKLDNLPNTNIHSSMGALTAMDTTTSAQRPHVFVLGKDGNLWVKWYSGSQWDWDNLDHPPNTNIHSAMGTLTVMDTTTSAQRPHVFVLGKDGNLWVKWYSGSQRNWANLGHPTSANIHSSMGALTATDTTASTQRPHVFVLGTDGNLWVDSFSGSQWDWTNLDHPPNMNIHSAMGALTVMDTTTSAQRPHVFVLGKDGNLWVKWYSGSQRNWANLGHPTSANIHSSMGALTVMDTTTSAQRPHVFVLGNDGNLWVSWYSGSQWNWTNLDHPTNTNIHSAMGAVTVMDTTTSAQRPHVFVLGTDGNLWLDSYSGSQWNWANLGKPQSANIHSSMGVLTVMDTTASAQRPHVFVLGNDGNLWVDWSG